MRLFVAIVVMMAAFSLNSQQPKSGRQQPKQTAATDRLGAQESPVVVKVPPPAKTPEGTTEEKKGRENNVENDRNLVKLTGVLAVVMCSNCLFMVTKPKN